MSGLAEGGDVPKALVTSTSMYVPKGARVSFEDDPPTEQLRLRDVPRSNSLKRTESRLSLGSRPRNRALTRIQTRTSYVDKAYDSMGSPTATFRVMSDANMTAKKLFTQLDADGSGYLDVDEVENLARMLGVQANEGEVRTAFEEMDDDGNGEISFEEFSSWWQNVRENDRRKVRRKVRNAFHKLDRHGNGTINKQEFAMLMSMKMRKLMNLLGEPFDLEKDWALVHRSFVERGGELTDSLLVSFSLFEKWWKFRNGIEDFDLPVIPETMALRINEAVRFVATPTRRPTGVVRIGCLMLCCPVLRCAGQGAMDPATIRRAIQRRREQQLAPELGTALDVGPQRRGAELWDFLRPRLRLLVELQTKWGDVSEIYDSHAKSYHEEVQLPRWIRDPNSMHSAAWDLIQIVFLAYISFGVPLRVCFDIEVSMWSFSFWLDNIVDLYFIVDLGLQFRTSFRRDDGMMEDDARAIAEKYLKTWFVIDFVSCIPVQYIGMAAGDGGGGQASVAAQADSSVTKDASGSQFKALKALRLVRMSKMLRLAKIKRILAKYQDQVDLMQYMEMYALIAIICLLAHMLACFFYLIGDVDEECFFESDTIPCTYDASNPGEPGILRGWVFMEFGSMAEPSLAPTLGARYWTSLYYVFNALEPHILTVAERGYAVMAELVIAIIYGSIAGVMSTIMIGLQGTGNEAQAKMGGLRRWVQYHKMPKAMQKGILAYFNELWTQRAGLNTANVLEDMPPQLRLEVTTIFYRDALASIPLFSGLSAGILFSLCRECRPVLFLKGQTVLREGTPGQEMYILLDGEVQVSVGGSESAKDDGSTSSVYKNRDDLGYLSAGAFFGESPVLSMLNGLEKYIETQDQKYLQGTTKDTVRSRTITAVTNCELLYLTRDAVMRVAIEYPELRARLLRFAKPVRRKPIEETLTVDDLAKLSMTRVRVKRTVDRTRGHNLTKKKRAKAAELAGRDKWAAKMQEKIKQSSAEVQEELARRAEKHATEFERKVQRAVQLMAG